MEWLKELLQETENGTELAKKITKEIQGNYILKEEYSTIAMEKEELEKQLKIRDTDLVELQKAAKGQAELEKQYQDLQAKYKADMEGLQQKIHQNKKESALDLAILKAKGRDPKEIKVHLNMEKINLKENGELEGFDLEELKKTKGYLFEEEKFIFTGAGIQRNQNEMGFSPEKQIAKAILGGR